ncbi:MAG: bifunctional riboflavin kinase/FAD synthetase [Acidimicrobiia bacterium]
MKVLEGDFRHWDRPSTAEGSAVTIGVYDGIHLGHQHVLAELKRKARSADGLPSTVLTFDRHPLVVVDPERAPRLLTTRQQKLEQFERLGMDVAAVITFDDRLRDSSPAQFAADVLVDAVQARLVVVGADFRFGRDRAGDVDTLRGLGQSHGFEVYVVELIGGNDPVSSTTIRRAIARGDVVEAAAALGRFYELRGAVIEGERRGALIGFPTANLEIHPDVAVPARGVYVAWASLPDGEPHPAAVNIGVRPTFGEGRETVEAHLLDWSDDLSRRELRLGFVERIRDELRFSGVEALVDQIKRDVEKVRSVLAERPGHG